MTLILSFYTEQFQSLFTKVSRDDRDVHLFILSYIPLTLDPVYFSVGLCYYIGRIILYVVLFRKSYESTILFVYEVSQ